MAATPQQTEAIKLISDWSKWLATIETGTIAVIGALVTKSTPPACSFRMGAFVISIVCFILSIWLIALILASLPAAVQDIGVDEKVWNRKTTWFFHKLPLWLLVWGQFILFGLGILTFGVGIILMMVGC